MTDETRENGRERNDSQSREDIQIIDGALRSMYGFFPRAHEERILKSGRFDEIIEQRIRAYMNEKTWGTREDKARKSARIAEGAGLYDTAIEFLSLDVRGGGCYSGDGLSRAAVLAEKINQTERARLLREKQIDKYIELKEFIFAARDAMELGQEERARELCIKGMDSLLIKNRGTYAYHGLFHLARELDLHSEAIDFYTRIGDRDVAFEMSEILRRTDVDDKFDGKIESLDSQVSELENQISKLKGCKWHMNTVYNNCRNLRKMSDEEIRIDSCNERLLGDQSRDLQKPHGCDMRNCLQAYTSLAKGGDLLSEKVIEAYNGLEGKLNLSHDSKKAVLKIVDRELTEKEYMDFLRGKSPIGFLDHDPEKDNRDNNYWIGTAIFLDLSSENGFSKVEVIRPMCFEKYSLAGIVPVNWRIVDGPDIVGNPELREKLIRPEDRNKPIYDGYGRLSYNPSKQEETK